MSDFDLLIVGAGVAGLTAATHAARQGLSTIVVDSMGVGGQILTAERIVNFPGFPQGIAGLELGPVLHEQAEAAGAAFALDTVEAIVPEGSGFSVRGSSEVWRTRAIIVAAGSTLRTLGVPGERELTGRGVSHCASCDGPLYKGQAVAVIGSGDSAADEALALAQHAAKVMLVCREPSLTAQSALRDEIAAKANIEVVTGARVDAIEGSDAVDGVRIAEAGKQDTRTLPVKAVFVYVGLAPNNGPLATLVELDAEGHIETDNMMRTSRAGIFAAGDIRAGSVAMLAAAAGDGATAAIAAARYLRGQAAS